MEKYSFVSSDPSYINHLLLDGEIDQLVKAPGFDPKNLQVELKVNGFVVRVEDFNRVLKDWGNRIAQQVTEQYQQRVAELEDEERAVARSAEQLLVQRLGSLEEMIDDLRNNSWKLYDK